MKKYIKYTLAILLSIVIFNSNAQQDRLKLTLQDALDLGLKNRLELQTQKLNVKLAENTLKRNKDQWLPTIEGSGNLRYNTQLQESVLPEGAFGGTTGSGSIRIPFGTKVNTTFSIDASQNLYKPSVNQEVKISQTNVSLEKEIINQTTSQIKLNITEAYYSALLRKEEIKILEKTLERAKKYLDVWTAKLSLGTVQENDLGKVKLDYQNVELKLRRAKQNLQLSLNNLAKNLNISNVQEIELTDNLKSKDSVSEINEDFMGFVTERSEIKQLVLTNDLNKLKYEKATLGMKPTVSAYANYSALYQSGGFNFFEKDTWSPFNYLGVKLSIPIFDQHKTRIEKSDYKILQEIGLNNWNKQKVELFYELQNAKTELNNAQMNLQYAQENYRLAEEVYQVSIQKYELGGMLYNDLLDTEKSLSEAENNILTNTYDLLIAKVRWQKAKGE
jgi:outer membrane protein